MSNLSDFLSIALNTILIFATVSFVAGAATDFIAGLLKWRENGLLRGVKELLNDPMFTGLARAVYDNILVNPRATGTVTSEAQLTYKPSTIDPSAFGVALLEVLHVVPSAQTGDEIPTLEKLTADEKGAVLVTAATANATAAINHYVSNAESRKQLLRLVENLILRTGADRASMEKSVAIWFAHAMSHVGEDYRRRTQLTNFVVALVIAALLDLKPIPIGGYGAVLDLKETSLPDTTIATLVQYANPYFQWVVVGLSTLFGGKFWFDILKRVAPSPAAAPSGPIVAPAGAPSPAAKSQTGPA